MRVLVVDDSAFVRKVVREMLTRSALIDVVGVARDGEEALKLVEDLRPDVVTCDLLMPQLDGVNFVRRQMARRAVPILILTATPQDASLAIEALEAGAVDFVQKPTALATEELLGIRQELVEKVRAAARAPIANLGRLPRPVQPAAPLERVTGTGQARIEVVVIGVSTGGPQALRHLLPLLPANFPVPIAIVLHMPVGYTLLMAEKLNEISALTVTEAKDGDVLRPGMALLAAAGRHLFLRRNRHGELCAALAVQPLDHLHRPSVDVLFQSAAEVLHDRVLGVVLTGMGEDGKAGAAWIKAQGGTVLTEAESSCIIYGMPRAVEEAGLSDAAVPLPDLARAIIERL
ncbi:MAG: chemotaxis response regulator protein-glutamate methylesterase [Opitutus sp.]|nr:chemotaxis response regulator protein-glutamate methylesterase [Opitutus sp.]